MQASGKSQNIFENKFGFYFSNEIATEMMCGLKLFYVDLFDLDSNSIMNRMEYSVEY